MTGTEQFDSDPVALVGMELPLPLGISRDEWARQILARLNEGGWDVVRRDEATGEVTEVWAPAPPVAPHRFVDNGSGYCGHCGAFSFDLIHAGVRL